MTTSRPEPVGVLVVDKPAGMTSHDVVARLRRVLGTRKLGHAGTLDPMATGVLVLACGRGTRLLPYLQATAKSYTATIRLGFATSTDDRTGEALAPARPVAVSAEAVDEVLQRFVGSIEQVPSAVSAVKVAGRRAYAMARAGEAVDLPARRVDIASLRRTGALRAAPHGGVEVDVAVDCSSGTYIRALARDIGEALGCGGHLGALRRTAVGPFGVDRAVPLPGPGDQPDLLPLALAACAVLPAVGLGAHDAGRAASGLRIPCAPGTGSGPVALLGPHGALIAVAQAVDGLWHYRAVFA